MAEIRRRNAHKTEDAFIDDTNLRLLAELQADARLSLAELGRRVGLSSPAVAERVQRLEQEQVILGYHARLNPRKLGLNLTAVIRVRPAGRQLHQVGELAKKTPEVVDCRRITGDDCYIMTAHVRSVEHLEEVIDRFASHGQTTTSIVQSAAVDSRGLSLQEDGTNRNALGSPSSEAAAKPRPRKTPSSAARRHSQRPGRPRGNTR